VCVCVCVCCCAVMLCCAGLVLCCVVLFCRRPPTRSVPCRPGVVLPASARSRALLQTPERCLPKTKELQRRAESGFDSHPPALKEMVVHCTQHCGWPPVTRPQDEIARPKKLKKSCGGRGLALLLCASIFCVGCAPPRPRSFQAVWAGWRTLFLPQCW
jgi:hypothetical protein